MGNEPTERWLGPISQHFSCREWQFWPRFPITATRNSSETSAAHWTVPGNWNVCSMPLVSMPNRSLELYNRLIGF
uniref:Uncharacterized protein n=1 Tax=Anopheles albimanus TaxID=7167 RepID=A0A182FX49_ANOAL